MPRFDDLFSRNHLSRMKDGLYAVNVDDKKAMEHIGFYCLLTEIQLHTLIEGISQEVLSKIIDNLYTHHIQNTR